MVRMTEEACARCTNHLATSNKHRDRLCGVCQRELGPRTSAAYREWITKGKRREVTRGAVTNGTANGTAEPSITLATARTEDLLAELRRRREEAERLIALLSSEPAAKAATS